MESMFPERFQRMQAYFIYFLLIMWFVPYYGIALLQLRFPGSGTLSRYDIQWYTFLL
jgi:hypothetical protein